MQLSRILAFPFLIVMAIGFFLALQFDTDYAMIVIPGVLALALIYIFSPQIDWYWYQRYPPDLPPKLRAFFEQHSYFYRQLTQDADRTRFRQQVALFSIATDFKSPNEDHPVTEDLKIVAAAAAVPLLFSRGESLIPPFENVVIFPQAFHSPQYPRYIHTSELFEEDGVLLFSAPHLLKGFMSPQEYYDIGLHEWARAYVLAHPQLSWPEEALQRWDAFAQISGFPASAIQQWVNRPDLELLPTTIVHYFQFPQAFRAVLPEAYTALEAIFQLESLRTV